MKIYETIIVLEVENPCKTSVKGENVLGYGALKN
jgi:hypothetical protein